MKNFYQNHAFNDYNQLVRSLSGAPIFNYFEHPLKGATAGKRREKYGGAQKIEGNVWLSSGRGRPRLPAFATMTTTTTTTSKRGQTPPPHLARPPLRRRPGPIVAIARDHHPRYFHFHVAHHRMREPLLFVNTARQMVDAT